MSASGKPDDADTGRGAGHAQYAGTTDGACAGSSHGAVRLPQASRLLRAAALVALCAWSLVAFVLLLCPQAQTTGEVSISTANLGHLLLFGGWTVLAGLAQLSAAAERINLRVLWIGMVLLGALTELLQALLPFDRTGSLFDVFLNAVGVSLGCAFLYRLQRRRGTENTTPRGRFA